MAIRALVDLPAPAKVNLFLHVVGRRDDGYHLLQSVFVPIDWTDVLHVEVRDDGRLQRHDLSGALPADDLCLRAARALQQASGSPFGADISIDKRVPAGAGLGGGSSDAATTLLALNRLWRLDWPRERLAALGLGLGADVPFFVGGRPALVEGIGERLTPLSLPPLRLVVVKPPASIDTGSLFAAYRAGAPEPAAILAGSFAGAAEAVASDPGWGRNDLQDVAERCCPEVADAADWLRQRYGNSRMSGSGSAVFARVGMDAPPLATCPALPPGWVGRSCRSLECHPLVGWAG